MKESGFENNMGERKRRWLYLLVPLVLAASVGAFSFLSSQPRFCNSCHIMRQDYSSWKSSTHKEVSCQECHQQSGITGFILSQMSLVRMVISNTSHFYDKPITAHIFDSPCLNCHRKIKKGIAVSNGIRISHKELPAGQLCTECHNTIAHDDVVKNKKQATMEKCTVCHNNKTTSAACETCHEKGVKITKRRKGPWQVVHGGKWRKTHGMGNLSSCSACHGEAYCKKCHLQMPHSSSWPYSHGKNAKQTGLDACYQCHQQSFCQECHWLDMPHNQKFLPEHPQIVMKKGEKICLNCHVRHDCDFCHSRHIHRAVTIPKKIGK